MIRSLKIQIVYIFLFSSLLYAQKDTTVQEFSLDEAKQYALQNNLNIRNAHLDIIKAKKKIWETTAIGLPQISAAGAYSYAITLSEQIEQFASIGQMFGDTASSISIDDLRSSTTIDIIASQLIFNGSYFVGLQAAKVYKNLSEIGHEISQANTIENVTNSYFLVLIARENSNILDSTYKNTEKTYNELKAMFDRGFVEETDVDQLQLTLQNIQSVKNLLARQVEISERLLKFQMGIDLDIPIELTDNLSYLMTSMKLDNVLTSDLVLENNLNYQILKTQEKLSELNLKRYKTEFLPTISGFYQHHENLNDDAVDFISPDMVGINVSIPIFSSGQKYAQVSQARIELEKTKNANLLATRGLIIEFEDAKSTFENAYDKYKIEKDNLQLAKRIYNITITKYVNGMSSSLDLSQAQNQYLEKQSEYYQSIIELVGAKLKIDRIVNNL